MRGCAVTEMIAPCVFPCLKLHPTKLSLGSGCVYILMPVSVNFPILKWHLCLCIQCWYLLKDSWAGLGCLLQGGGSTDKVPFANWRVNRWHGQHSRSLWTWVYHSPGSHLVVFSPLTHSLAYFLGTILPLLFTLLNLKQKLGLKPFRKRTKPVRFSANPFNLCWSPNHAVLSCGEIFSYCLMHRNPFPLSFCF